MTDKGSKGLSQQRGKTLKKSVAKKPGNQSKRGNSSSTKLTQIDVDSSDSEYEGFLDDKSLSPKKGNRKVISDPKTGKETSTGLKASDKASSMSPSVDWDKSGKGFTFGKAGGKGGVPQTKAVKTSITDKELKLELELPPGAKIVMDCEAAAILLGIQEHLENLKDPKIKIPESFNHSLKYTKIAVHYTDIKSVRQALENLKEHGATDGEICMIGNSGPETAEEAYALIPSLEEKKDKIGGPLNVALAALAQIKVSQGLPD
ncbi:hypothetical protein HPP92_000509 [Vanilla planifolia]|uniref:RNA polymerase Rpb4/RPC9 core domain-containing protein n=1 Tax=Vanilla planifolia TaxID=51239 RepID=A0A835VG12_VANPL|nr:hypothetical protein HPP92_000509 [Vanilla planifolia]